MATVQFYKDYSWENHPPSKVKRLMPIETVIYRLDNLKTEWQGIADSEGKSLVEVQIGAGYLLYDLCNAMELSPDEILSVLGPELLEAIQ